MNRNNLLVNLSVGIRWHHRLIFKFISTALTTFNILVGRTKLALQWFERNLHQTIKRLLSIISTLSKCVNNLTFIYLSFVAAEKCLEEFYIIFKLILLWNTKLSLLLPRNVGSALVLSGLCYLFTWNVDLAYRDCLWFLKLHRGLFN